MFEQGKTDVELDKELLCYSFGREPVGIWEKQQGIRGGLGGGTVRMKLLEKNRTRLRRNLAELEFWILRGGGGVHAASLAEGLEQRNDDIPLGRDAAVQDERGGRVRLRGHDHVPPHVELTVEGRDRVGVAPVRIAVDAVLVVALGAAGIDELGRLEVAGAREGGAARHLGLVGEPVRGERGG